MIASSAWGHLIELDLPSFAVLPLSERALLRIVLSSCIRDTRGVFSGDPSEQLARTGIYTEPDIAEAMRDVSRIGQLLGLLVCLTEGRQVTVEFSESLPRRKHQQAHTAKLLSAYEGYLPYKGTWTHGLLHPVGQHDLQRLKTRFPAVDIESELPRMHAWLCDKRNRRHLPTERGLGAFMSKWLRKAKLGGRAVGDIDLTFLEHAA